MSLQFKMKLNSNYFRWVTRLAGWQPAAGKTSSSLFILICVLVIIVLVLNRISARYGVTIPHTIPYPYPILTNLCQVWGHPQTAPRAHGEPGLRRGAKGDFQFSQRLSPTRKQLIGKQDMSSYLSHFDAHCFLFSLFTNWIKKLN